MQDFDCTREGVDSVHLTPMLLKDQLLSAFGGGKLRPVNYRAWESYAQNLVTVKVWGPRDWLGNLGLYSVPAPSIKYTKEYLGQGRAKTFSPTDPQHKHISALKPFLSVNTCKWF